MSHDRAANGLAVFDSTVNKAHEWLDEIATDLDLDDRHAAYTALRAALHTLRDRLTVEEAVQLGAQLPMLVRGLYYEGWTLRGKPVKWHRQEFLDVIGDSMRGLLEDCDPEDVACAVFRVLARHITSGEMEDIGDILPKDLRELVSGASWH